MFGEIKKKLGTKSYNSYNPYNCNGFYGIFDNSTGNIIGGIQKYNLANEIINNADLDIGIDINSQNTITINDTQISIFNQTSNTYIDATTGYFAASALVGRSGGALQVAVCISVL